LEIMKNQELAKIFYEFADYLEMEGVAFKPYAYRRAADAIEALEEGVEKIYAKEGLNGLEKISSVGYGIARGIEEYLQTGKIKKYREIKKKLPINLAEITSVEGLGPKKAKVLYQKLKIKNLKDLKRAAKARKIAPLFGFDEKTERNILEGIKFLERSKGRFLLGEVLPKAKEVQEKLKSLKEIEQISLAGSVRRMKETIGDVDFLVAVQEPKKEGDEDKSSSKRASEKLKKKNEVLFAFAAARIMDFFVSLPGVVKVWGKGMTKSSVRLKDGGDEVKTSSSLNPSGLVLDMDIRVVPKKSYGSALQYLTGSKEHNIATRRIAIKKKLKLNEYGVFRGKKMVAGKTEEDVYKILGLQWIPPEMRENQGEIEEAARNNLPKIIEYGDIKGDLHIHTSWSDGTQSVKDMALAAKAMGYEYIGISDHTKFLTIANGLEENRLLKQMREIDKVNQGIKGIKVLKGAEVNILENGSLDIRDEILAKLDYVIAGVHSKFKMDKEEMTERIINAMKNKRVDIIAHISNRRMPERGECQFDFDKILRAAKKYNVVLEINCQPVRMDLKDINIKRAKEAGVKMAINTDSHHKDQLKLMEFGISQARRGWAEKKDIINSQPLEKLLKFFK